MSFATWSEERKKREQQEEERTQNTKAVTGGKTTFTEWSNNRLVENMDEEYISNFISDADEFFKSSENDFKGIGWSNASSTYSSKASKLYDLETRGKNIRSWLSKNKNKIDAKTYSNLTQALDNFDKDSVSIIESFLNARDFYAQFDTEDAYNAYMEERKAVDAILNAEDFEEYYNLGLNAENPSFSDSKPPVNIMGWKPFGDGEDVTNKVTFAEKYYQTVQDEITQKTIGGQVTPWLYNDTYKPILDIYNHMTEDEKKVYNYYIGKGETQKAEEYLNGLQDKFEQRAAGELTKWDETPLELLVSFSTGLEQFGKGISNLDDLFKGTEGDSSVSRLQYATSQMGQNNDGVWKVANDLANTTGNMLPSILLSTIVPVGGALVGTASMGLSASGNAYAEMRNLGYTANQARAYAGMVGVSEAALQYALGGISKLGGKVTGNVISKYTGKLAKAVSGIDNAIARVAINYGGQMLGKMGSEALEEATQSILEPIFKTIVTGENLDIDWGEVAYSALLGGLSAGFLEGGATLVGNIAYDTSITKHGQKLIDGGSVDTLQQLAREMYGVDTDVQAASIKAKTKQTAHNVGNLSLAMENSVASQNLTDATNALVEKGLSQKEASKVAEKLLNDGKLSKNQLSNEAIKAVVEEVVNNPASSMGERNAKLRNARLGTKTNASGNGVAVNKKVDIKDRVSADGVTKQTSTGETITIDKSNPIAKTKDGKVYYNTDKGVVESSDVSYASEAEGLVYESFVDLNPAFANALIRNYDGKTPIQTYVKGMREGVVLYGRHNFQGVGKDISKATYFAELSEADQAFALKLGRNYATHEAKVADAPLRKAIKNAAERAKAEGASNTEGTKKTLKEGTVRFEDGVKESKDIKSSVKLAKVIARAIGTDIVFYDARKTKDKEGKGANGYYDPDTNTIHLDIQKARTDTHTIAFTLSHELVHWMKKNSATDFNNFAKFLMEQYASHGINTSKLLAKKMLELNTKDSDYAYEEMICDACETLLLDSNAVAKLQMLREQDLTLFEKIKLHIRNLLDKLRAEYKKLGYNHTTDEAKALLSMTDVLEQIYEKFEDAMVGAAKNAEAESLMDMEANTDVVPVESVVKHSYKSLAEAAGFVAVEDENGIRSFTRDGKKVSEVTVEDIENSPIGAFINYSLEQKDITKEQADEQKEMFAKICTLCCKTNDFSMTMQFMGSAVFTAMKANADKQYGTTYDMPSICTKTQAVIDAMSARMVKLGRGLEVNEIEAIYNEVFTSGNPVPCPECYVFSRWIGIGSLLNNIKQYQEYYGKMDVKEVAKAFNDMYSEIESAAAEMGITFGKAKGALVKKYTKEYNKLTEKIEKQENQGEKVKDADRKKLKELESMQNTVKAMTWIENVYFADAAHTKVNKNFKVPDDVLFDLNMGEKFATQYKEAWAFRTTQGAGYGKAITPYAEVSLGEGVLVTNNTTNAIKGKQNGTLNNYFLQQRGTVDKVSKKALDGARLRQKIQAFLGGQRFQSTSDARYENASDYLLAALEMQAMHGMVQVYTKVDGAVSAFEGWGFSSNQSLMPKGSGLDENGNVVDTSVGGMNPKVAFANRNKHEHAGTITIGVNDNHIRALIQMIERDFVIPYHASGGKADVVAEFRRIQEGYEKKGIMVRSTDYSRTQSDKVLSDEVLRWLGKTDAEIEQIHKVRDARIAILTRSKVDMDVVRGNRFLSALYDKFHGGEWDGVKLPKGKVDGHIYPNEFWDTSVTYEESGKITADYLEYCDDLGYLHRFSGLVPSNGMLVAVKGYDENGNRVTLTDLAFKVDENGQRLNEIEPFYWKVLTDRRMYGHNGQYLPQQIVTLNSTTEETVTNFAKKNDGRQYDKEVSLATAKKVSEGNLGIKKQAKNANSNAYDFTKPFYKQVEDYINGVFPQDDSLVLGATPEVFQKIGFNALPITINQKHVDYALNGTKNSDHEIGEIVLKYLPTALKNPVAIITSKTANSTSVVAILSITHNGNQINVPIFIDGFGRQNGIRIDSNAVTSVYARKNAVYTLLKDALIDEVNGGFGLLYWDKKRALALLSGGKVIMPNLPNALNDGFVHSIHEKNSPVKPKYQNVTESQQFKRWFGDWQNNPKQASKVVNDDGTPMVVYHGSTVKDIDIFQTSNANGTGGLYLTTNRSVAESFAGEDGEVYESYVNLRKPLIIDANGAYYDNIPTPSEMVGNKYAFGGNTVDTNAIAAYARGAGYDGVIVKNVREVAGFGDDIIAFQPEQIKSATDNIGTFDPNNQRIKFQKKDTQRDSDRILMGSLFSGGGTLEAGLTYQMLDKQFGVEYDGKIASVYADNHGDHIQVGRVEDFDIRKYKDVFYLHASPVCHNFSKAKHGAKELQMDKDSARATAMHLEMGMPQVFTVENAPGYRKSESLKIITDKLTELGYKWDVDVYNSADYGSATSRNRVILRAVKDGELPPKPSKQERTNSWDKVTRDLWDTLPKSSLRPSFISAIENTPNLPILDADGNVNVNKPLLILTTTSGHQVTFCWEGEICPTLTTKCGEAKLVMPDGNIYAVTPEFMGRIQGLPDNYKYPKEKTRAFTIIGNGIPTHLTKAVVGGVLDSAYQQTHNGKVLHQKKKVSNRTLLANALETTIDTSTQDGQNQLKKLKEYQSKVEELDKLESHLADVKQQIYDISFTKGSDRSKLTALNDDKIKTQNRIHTYDSQLTRLEAMKPIQDVLAREKDMLREKVEAKAKEAFDAYREHIQTVHEADIGRERAEKRAALNKLRERQAQLTRDLMNRHQESRKKGVESRNKTALKRKLRKVIGDLNKIFSHGTKERNVKKGAQDAVASALALGEVLFSDEISNADIVTLGVDSVTEKESKWLNEYRDALDMMDALLAENEVNKAKYSGEELVKRMNEIADKIGKLQNKINRLNSELSDVFARERARLNRSTVATLIDQLAKDYKILESSEEEYLKNAFSTESLARIEKLSKDLEGTLVKDMSLDQLEEVYNVFKMVKHMVTTANNLFREGKTEDLVQRVSNVQRQLFWSLKLNKKDPVAKNENAKNLLKSFWWNEMKPLTAFEALGSKAFEELFWDAVKADGDFAKLITEAGTYLQEQREKYHYADWDANMVKEFTLSDGKVFKLTLGDIMSIYAYTKRDQAYDHMTNGGFTFDENNHYKGKLFNFKNKNSITEILEKLRVERKHAKLTDTYLVDDATLNEIVKLMNSKEYADIKAYTDAMQEYFKVMAQKGNEISNVLYGIDLFGEEFYIPLQSSSDYMNSNKEALNNAETQVSLKNIGMTKATKPHASNPIVLRQFDELWLDHIDKMSKYCAYVLPIENLQRVFNNVSSVNGQSPISTKALIASIFGNEARNYIDQYITDLNGGSKGASGYKNPLMSMFAKFKKTAVGAKLSVVIQQPFAILRAMSEIRPDYFLPFLHGISRTKGIKVYEELKKYAPVAILKEMGGFDIGSSGSVKSYIGTTEYHGLKGKAKGLIKDADYRSKALDDGFMFGASLMDKLGWDIIWLAVKKEVAAQNKYAKGSEEFLNACGERFQEVVLRTQVYDSVNSRSGMMRSKSDATKFATSFAGEPTTIVNMYISDVIRLVNAYKFNEPVGKHWAKIGRDFGVITASIIITTLAKTAIYANYDDDDDESWTERWMRNFGDSLTSDLNPLTMLPFVRDLVSVWEGWTIERPDMALLADLTESIRSFYDEKKEGEVTMETVYDFIGDMANALGIPVKNIVKDTKGIVNVIEGWFDDVFTTDTWGAFKEGWSGGNLYGAVMNGDENEIAYYRKHYDSTSDFNSALSKALRENDPRIKEAAQADIDGDAWKYDRIVSEILGEGNFSENVIKSAITSEINKLTEAEDEDDSEPKKKSIYDVRHYDMAIEDGNSSLANKIKEDIIETHIENGKSRDDAESAFESSLRTHYRDKYKESSISRSEAMNVLVAHGGLDSDDAYWELKRWDYYVANNTTEGYSKYTEFYKAVETGSNLKAVINEHLTHGAKKSDLATQITKYYKPLYKEMSNSERARLKGYLLNAYVLLGYKRTDKSKDIDNWLKD